MPEICASIRRRRSTGIHIGCRLQTDLLTSRSPFGGAPAPVMNRHRRSDGRHVLLVQSRSVELQTMAEMLRILGYHVTSAENCGKALLYFGREPCEVVISELDMSGFNGFQLARCIRRHSPGTRILLMTACCQAEVVDYMDCGVVDGWLFKPFRMELLEDMLKSALNTDKEVGWTIQAAAPMALNNWWKNGAMNSGGRKTPTITQRPITRRLKENL
jgi:DNA-binding response OmpR family regulator